MANDERSQTRSTEVNRYMEKSLPAYAQDARRSACSRTQ